MTPEHRMPNEAITEAVKALLEKVFEQLESRNCTAPLLVIVAPAAPCDRGPVRWWCPPAAGPPKSDLRETENTILAVRLIQRWKLDKGLQARFGEFAMYAEHVERMLVGECKWEPALLPPDEAETNRLHTKGA